MLVAQYQSGAFTPPFWPGPFSLNHDARKSIERPPEMGNYLVQIFKTNHLGEIILLEP
jgi:hypothetical protein